MLASFTKIAMRLISMRVFWIAVFSIFLGSGPFRAVAASAVAARDEVLISVADQKMRFMRNGQKVFDVPISTSKFGEGDFFNSYRTPLGHFVISRKIGDGLPAGAVLKRGQPTGEVLAVNAQGRDPIVTRILCLRGQESTNQNAEGRRIYIHGTPEEKRLGRKASFGCIRMSSYDVIRLYRFVRPGTPVTVQNMPLRAMAKSASQVAQVQRMNANRLMAGASFDRD